MTVYIYDVVFSLLQRGLAMSRNQDGIKRMRSVCSHESNGLFFTPFIDFCGQNLQFTGEKLQKVCVCGRGAGWGGGGGCVGGGVKKERKQKQSNRKDRFISICLRRRGSNYLCFDRVSSRLHYSSRFKPSSFFSQAGVSLSALFSCLPKLPIG